MKHVKIFKKILLLIFIFLLHLNFIQAMDGDLPEKQTLKKQSNLTYSNDLKKENQIILSKMPLDVLDLIFSFLTQNDLLRAQRVSNDWKKDLAKVWNNKPLTFNGSAEEVKCIVNSNFSELSELHIITDIGDVGGELLSKSNLSRLTILNFANPFIERRIGSKGVASLSKGKFFALTDLCLSGTNIGPEEIKSLTTGNLTSITKLNLSDNNIGPEGAKILAMGNLTSIRNLILFRNNIGDDGVLSLFSTGIFSTLTELDLGNNNIGSKGAKNFFDRNFSELKKLSLSCVDIGPLENDWIFKGNFSALKKVDFSCRYSNYEESLIAERIAKEWMAKILPHFYYEGFINAWIPRGSDIREAVGL